MKIALKSLLLGAALLVPSIAMAGTVKVSYGPGTLAGIFNVKTSTNGSFETFCLESTEVAANGATYYYEISTAARYNNVVGGMDPMSKATAWLFRHFRTLLGYTNTAAFNDLVQQAFWFLEGETGGVDNDFSAAAKAAVGSSWNDDANGYLNVYVMNLNENAVGNFAGRRQDMLITVPDGGTTLALLGLGLLGLVAARRKLRAA